MKIKIYLNDWFINMGIIGFIRIIESAEKKQLLDIKNDYLQFDSSILLEFHKDYFNYFLRRYDIAKRECEKVDRYFLRAKKEDKFKDSLKYIKIVVDNNRKKITGKFENHVYQDAFDEVFKSLGDIKGFEEIDKLDDIINKFKILIRQFEVNNKLTMNYFRSIVSSQYFGQASFLQRNCAAKTVIEQADIVYKDYIKPVLEEMEFEELLSKSINMDDFKINLVEKSKEDGLTKEFQVFINNIIKKTKTKNFDEIRYYIQHEMAHCSIWENYRANSNFTEGVFLPLAISMGNAKNFMWNFNTSYPICNLIKLILLCSPAGAMDMQEDYFGFVNMDTSLEELYKCNESFNQMEDKECAFENLIYDIVTESEKKSKWMLGNILFIEFNASYEAKKCNLNYFNIPKSTALYFKTHAKQEFSKMYDRQFRNALVKLILNNRAFKTITYKDNHNDKDISIVTDINSLIDAKLKNDIKVKSSFAYDVIIATITNYKLSKIKGGSEEMDSKKIWVIFKSGQELNRYYTNKESANKIQGISYRLLNASKAGNKNSFMDSVLRIYMTAGIEIPTLFLNVLHESELDFETVAHAFISGLISSEKTHNDNIEKLKGEN